jgi:hypothetical protein
MITQLVEEVRAAIASPEISDTTLTETQMVGFDAGYAAAAAGDLDLCQGTMDRVNLLLDAGDDAVDFAIGNLIGFVQYHQELLHQMADIAVIDDDPEDDASFVHGEPSAMQ